MTHINPRFSSVDGQYSRVRKYAGSWASHTTDAPLSVNVPAMCPDSDFDNLPGSQQNRKTWRLSNQTRRRNRLVKIELTQRNMEETRDWLYRLGTEPLYQDGYVALAPPLVDRWRGWDG